MTEYQIGSKHTTEPGTCSIPIAPYPWSAKRHTQSHEMHRIPPPARRDKHQVMSRQEASERSGGITAKRRTKARKPTQTKPTHNSTQRP